MRSPSRRSDPQEPSTPRRAAAVTPSGTPGRAQRTPRRQQGTPARQQGTPARQQGTPARQLRTSARQQGTPARQQGTPARQQGTPGRGRPTPTRRTPVRGTSLQGSPTQSGRRRLSAINEAAGEAVGDQVVMDSDPLVSPLPGNPNLTSPFPGGISEIDLSSPLNYGTPGSLSTVRTPRSGILGTPIHARPNIRSDKRIRQVVLHPDEPESQQAPSSDLEPMLPQLVIWGTDVVVSQCKERFKQFVLHFTTTAIEEDENREGPDGTEDLDVAQPLYLQKLQEVHTLDEPFLNVNCAHLESFDADLYRQLVCYPQEVIPTFDMAVNDMFFDRYPAAVLNHQIQVRPFNAKKTRNMRALNPEDIDQLITIAGMVIRTSNVIPEMREAFFRCIVCGFSTLVELDRGRIAEPTLCTHCNTNHCFQLVHNRSQFTDKQIVKLQESPEDMPAGQTPYTVVAFAHNDLVDSVQAGDRVTLTGIYRATPLQVNPRMRNVRSVYKTHIDVVHFRKVDVNRLHDVEEGRRHRFCPERVEFMQALSQKDDIYERLAHAIAPSIYENEDIKKGLLLQLFGGTKKTFTSAGRGHFRAEINVLLCGDPGTSKSQLLQYVFNLLPRSQYTSGKGSSAVGLTAYVTKDPETRQLVLQTGALVLADNGICCIDEFDKMNDSTRSVLHEVMEQQTLSIAKAGIICQLNARTSILAAANPCESQWNKNKTIVENIMLPHTLMSRFDLIFLILDPQDELFDRRLARHLVSLYYEENDAEADQVLAMNILRDYIAYAREHIHPKLSGLAGQRLIQAYVDMRKIGSGRGHITAYPRQLESLIRLAEAHAKVRFSETVEVIDVEEAWRLHREALKQSATDPLSGKIDVSILTTGMSSVARKRRLELAQALRRLVEGKGKGQVLPYQKLFAEFKEGSQLMVTRELFEDAIKDLQDDGVLIAMGKNAIRVC